MIFRGFRIKTFWSKILLLCVVVFVLLFYFKSLNNYNSLEKNSLDSNVPPQKYYAPVEPIEYQQIENNQLVKENYEEMIEQDLRKQEPGLGENGRIAHLKGSFKEIGEKQLAVIALNEELSEHISYNR